jgi:hypothetical protein
VREKESFVCLACNLHLNLLLVFRNTQKVVNRSLPIRFQEDFHHLCRTYSKTLLISFILVSFSIATSYDLLDEFKLTRVKALPVDGCFHEYWTVTHLRTWSMEGPNVEVT